MAIIPFYLEDSYFTFNGLFHIFLSIWLSFNILFNYFMTIFTSPGTTKNMNFEEEIIEHAKNENVPLRGKGWSKYCKICKNIKPPRTHHCHVCNKCVLRMDHHCRIIFF
jgi:hypothetical protein